MHMCQYVGMCTLRGQDCSKSLGTEIAGGYELTMWVFKSEPSLQSLTGILSGTMLMQFKRKKSGTEYTAI